MSSDGPKAVKGVIMYYVDEIQYALKSCGSPVINSYISTCSTMNNYCFQRRTKA
jgi:hypothetical protein